MMTKTISPLVLLLLSASDLFSNPQEPATESYVLVGRIVRIERNAITQELLITVKATKASGDDIQVGALVPLFCPTYTEEQLKEFAKRASLIIWSWNPKFIYKTSRIVSEIR